MFSDNFQNVSHLTFPVHTEKRTNEYTGKYTRKHTHAHMANNKTAVELAAVAAVHHGL